MHDDLRRALTDRYDREAREYRELWAPVLRHAGLELLRQLSSVPATTVVDVATGVGTLLPELRRSFPAARILGVDRSRGMLAEAPAGFPLAMMDAERLGIASGSADLVVLAFVLFHLESPLEGLREARRVLRVGGRVGAITWAGELESATFRIWKECLDAQGAAPADPAADLRHQRVDSPEKMESLLHEAGFRPVRSWLGDLVCTIDQEQLVRLRTSLGAAKPRYDSLSAQVQEACRNAARARFECLEPDAFVARGKVVYSLGSAA